VYYDDHELPHFHVRYGEQKAIIAIDTLSERLFIRGGITMGIRPLHDWVLIEPSEAKETTAGGVFIPDAAHEKPVEGKVLAVGKGRWETPEKKWGRKPKEKEEKVFNATVLKPGDQVLYEKYGTTPVDLDGKELVLVRESDVLGWNKT